MLLDFLTKNILGIIEDNWPSFAIGYLYKQNPGLYFEQLGFPHGYYLNPAFNEPFSQIPFLTMSLYLDEILAFNLFIIASFALNIFFGYKFFRGFNNSRTISTALSVIFAFAPYFRYQSRSHPDLIQFWPLFILFGTVIRSKLSIKTSIKTGVFLYIASCFANYLGFFGWMIANLVTGIRLIQEKISLRTSLKVLFTQNFIYTILFVSTIFVTYFKLPEIIKPQIEQSPNLNKSIPLSDISRNIEDFFYFSLRPWYFITPTPENPITGAYAKTFIEVLQTKWGYWLTFDYFPSEHSAAFLGFTNIFLAILGIRFLLSKNNYQQLKFNKHLLIIIFCVSLFIILVTLPPYFTISDIKIYTPNYLIYLLFNLFRTTARLGIINLAFVLILSGFGYQYLQTKITHKNLFRLLIFIIFLFQFLEFWSPIRIINISKAPQVYTVLANIPERNLVIYPYSQTIDVAFWIRAHNKNIINTHAFKTNNFDSKQFTGNLSNLDGINKLLCSKAELFVYFNIADKNKNTQFFDSVPFLQKIESIQIDQNDQSYKNFLINYNVLADRDSSAIIYKITRNQNQSVDYNCINDE